MRDFRRLVVWQRSHRLALDVAELVRMLDPQHRFVIGDQLLRASLSIPANIAEGAGRASIREFRRHLTIAVGSAAELESHFYFCRDSSIANPRCVETLLMEVSEVQRMLVALRREIRF